MIYVYDIETFSNYCVVVFKEHQTEEFSIFEIYEGFSQADKLIKFISQPGSKFVGFNNLKFDAQVLHYIKLNPTCTAEQIYEFVQTKIIDQDFPPYFISQFSDNQIDLVKIWHFDNKAKMTSLKWIEFFFRENKIEDMPYDHTSKIDNASRRSKVISYCKFDVDKTHNFLKISKPVIVNRGKYASLYNDNSFINLPDPSLGEKLFLISLSEKLGIDPDTLKKQRTHRNKIVVDEVILKDQISFDYKEFQELYEFFSSQIINSHNGEIILKKAFDYQLNFKGLDIVYGVGGIHGCTDPGVYTSNEVYSILDIDVKSFYPNLGAQNDLFPEHLGIGFTELTKELFAERLTHPKGSIEEAGIKLRLNSAYGKSNSAYSFFYDPKYTVSITVNGQLLLSMLVEWLASVDNVRVLQVNTDGLTIRVPRSVRPMVDLLCKKWEERTNLTLEYVTYSKMVIIDVNNYLAINAENGKIKRKGRFELYSDMLDSNSYHKNPSANIVPLALNHYYVDGVDIETTIKSCTDIYEFLYGIKRKRNFVYVLSECDSNGVIQNNTVYNERVIRYCVVKSGGNLLKVYNDFRVSQVEKSKLVTILQNIHARNRKIEHHKLDYDHYINECNDVINALPIKH